MFFYFPELVLVFSIPLPAYAGLIPDLPGCAFTTGIFGANCVPIFIGQLIKWILGFTGGICLINIMIGGYQIALGSAIGDKEAGKSRVLWALVGLLVSMLSYGILNTIIGTLSL
ncbi:hypothetical protein A3H22_02060 [Candidatus Peribacteria bacterium RIFCSPLOWO2_12_FULL_55_15]|nr:MAG: hypothetical protein A2789_03030 [Candidatus Peribacteria bacterium RIFCSPHIGHO2_01_FULL_54_22]OGJ62424.1 MAG: hypothetical protein A3D12_01395 [Candidatus Peribacteria bacterium RIFCSPHIGHO2_02_FULL_55_24]OGJ64000.1 MAG: hypothetical protein A3E47_02765 [Candidatus Peribacteria bacterium RIFCSPHIGHO2_12_FULL_54_10]OGJ68789.1 MAG: hypothetical protein A2947_02975 [Candidatus Peribacteria bacterium RIFCSPLOWO2_01_FULL_54_110]OGJ69328.1 MAG: hypothetical protein A3H90_00785 [Candidatus Pe